jgi:hypothetical protein
MECEKRIACLCSELSYYRSIGWVLGGYMGVTGSHYPTGRYCPEFFDAGAYDHAGVQHRQSSLALSLGLVGALSIVRFRAAIKEPEELAYLFLAIGIGLGLGAGEPLLTICALVVIIAIIILRSFSRPRNTQNHVCAHISSNRKIGIKDVVDLLAKHGASASLRRFDETPERMISRLSFSSRVRKTGGIQPRCEGARFQCEDQLRR